MRFSAYLAGQPKPHFNLLRETMRKKKILWVNDASWKGTGYATYSHEVLSRMHKVEEFEIAEIACYADRNDKHIKDVPWKVYANRPLAEDADFEDYARSPTRAFGDHVFNSACIDFKPDIVMDIRDWWMFEFEQRSPFRDFFHWSIMPTVDAMPQNTQWMHTFADADSVFAYSEFGRDVLLEQSDQINFIDVASPAANEIYKPVADKFAHKESMGLDGDSIIIGTVMRNQRRKLYPDLFKVFRDLLDRTKNPNVFLYCHTYYPDIGWEIPDLLDQFGLSNRVLFTYKCPTCGTVSADFFKDSVCFCENCKTLTKRMVGIDNPIDNKELSKIYNLFDLYVQYANSEGFGMPQLEAACCGVPFVAMNYSAMESVIENTGAWPINPLALAMECETGCYRAIPDNDAMVTMLEKIIENPSALRPKGIQIAEQTRSHYNWDKTAQVWIDYFKSVPMKDLSETWFSAPQIKQPVTTIPSKITELTAQINYIFEKVLHKPEWIGTYFWAKVVKDITFGYRVQNSEEDYYFNESHLPSQDKYQRFNMEMAVKELTNLRNQWNSWEEIRQNVNTRNT